MTVTIPAWIFWTVGGVVGGGLMLLGIVALWVMWKGRNIDFRINW